MVEKIEGFPWLLIEGTYRPEWQPHSNLATSSSQIKVWTANPQQFVEDEDDDTFSYTVRIAAQDLLLVRVTLLLQPNNPPVIGSFFFLDI